MDLLKFVLLRRCYPVKKSFDAVTWMRKRRTEIDEEDKGLSWEEKRDKTRKLLEKDPLWLRLKNRVVEVTEFPRRSIRTNRAEYPEKHT
jgi:hypothetical protein